jgi:hypothetical protein
MLVSVRSPIVAVYSELASSERRPDHQWVRLADVVRLDAAARWISAATEPCRRSDPLGLRPDVVGVGGYEAGAVVDESDRARDPLETCECESRRAPVGFAIGECVAHIVQRSRESRLADHKRGAARALVLGEARRRERRRPDIESGGTSSRRDSGGRPGHGASRSSCSSARGRPAELHEPLEELGHAGQRVLPVHEHAVRVQQPLPRLPRQTALGERGDIHLGQRCND